MAGSEQLKQVFVSKDLPVLLIHPVSAIRGQITTNLKEAGFATIVPAENITEAVGVLREGFPARKFPGWILSSLFVADKMNALQVGRLLASTPELQSVLWSIIASPEELYALPVAIENGLLSWHPTAAFTQGDLIGKEISELITTVTAMDFSHDLVSLRYARNYLRESGDFPGLLRLTAALVEMKPDNPEFLLDHAQALALRNEIENARRYARRAAWADKNLIAKLGGITTTDRTPVFTESEVATLQESNQSILTAFGIGRCVIADPDEAVRNHLRKAMNDLGVSEVVEFDDGQSAWDFICGNHGNTIVISEWKLPKLSGMALLQRIHHEGFQNTPVIISSAQLGPQDKGLLEELGSAVLLQKPLSLGDLEANIRLAVKEENLPSSFKGMIRRVRGMLRKGEVEEAKKTWESATNEMLIPGVHRKMMDAEILFAEGKLEEAYSAAQEASLLGAKGAYFYNLIGRILFDLSDFDGSAEWLEKANQEVPINLSRLTNLAEVELHRGNIEKAEEQTATASEIDAENPMVVETKAMVAIEKGEPEEAKALMSQLNDLMNIVAHLNNRAVTMAWKGDPDKGIHLYREALASAPDSSSEGSSKLTPFVTYNLALALARKGDLAAAQKVIAGLDAGQAQAIGERLLAKIGAFTKRVDQAIKTGAKLEIETPKTSSIARKRIKKIKDAPAPSSGQIVKTLKLMGTIDYRALKLVEKTIRLQTGAS